jgi:glyoxalase family protein
VKLEGIHHVTCITADAPGNVDFYAGTLGLRLVKKTVNQDDPTVYHLFYSDERGSAGADITFFEYPDSPRGRAGAGMVHRIAFRVASNESLDFWQERIGGERSDGSLVFQDPEGLALQLVIDDSGEEPLVARHPEIPEEHALRGFAGVRAYASDPDRSRSLLEGTLGFEPGYVARGDKRSSFYVYDEHEARGFQGAGTVHHVAWASTQENTRPGAPRSSSRRAADAGHRPLLLQVDLLPRAERRSLSRSPRSARVRRDEPAEHLGERLSLPPRFEHLREQVEPVLTPLPNPRAERV